MPLVFLLLLMQSPAFQVTASQGDGSQCTATKNAGAKVNLTFACVNPIRGLPSETHRIYNAGAPQPRQTGHQLVVFGDVSCLFVVNPTAATATFGTLTVPANALWYSCAVGTADGRGAMDAAGIIAWP